MDDCCTFLVASSGSSLFFCVFPSAHSFLQASGNRLENITKLPPQLQHKSSFFYYHQIPVSQNKLISCQGFPWHSSSPQRLLIGLKTFLPALHRNMWSIVLDLCVAMKYHERGLKCPNCLGLSSQYLNENSALLSRLIANSAVLKLQRRSAKTGEF